MAFTNDDYLPSYEELTVPEIKLSSAVLRAGAIPFGKYCDDVCKEFMLCRSETGDPRKCINEGKEVTRCGFEFFGKVKKHCGDEFTKYWKCIDYSGSDMALSGCRKQQALFDSCLKEHLNLERPEVGYFSMVRVHKTPRPKPEKIEPPFPPELPEGPPVGQRQPKAKNWPDYGIVM